MAAKANEEPLGGSLPLAAANEESLWRQIGGTTIQYLHIGGTTIQYLLQPDSTRLLQVTTHLAATHLSKRPLQCLTKLSFVLAFSALEYV